MAPIPKRKHLTSARIFEAYAKQVEQWDSLGISISEAALECSRALWYSLRWASSEEEKPGRIRRRLDTGQREEQRMYADLSMIGVSISDKQAKLRALAGHLRGKADAGCVVGLPEAPKAKHVLEMKALNQKRFNAVLKHGVEKAEPLHYGQLQLGMHILGIENGAYFFENTNDDDLHLERVKYDIHYASFLMAKLRRIAESPNPPGRIGNGPEDHRCMFCKHKGVCFGGELLRKTCRSCIFAKPEFEGDASWSCERLSSLLTIDEQKEGCAMHLNIPSTVPGEQIDVNKEAGTITYRISDEITWVDGPADMDN